MRRVRAVITRTAIAFYRDQMTQHAAAITYYSLMSLFPVLLLALSLLGVVGEYPRTYNAIVDYLRTVAPESVVQPIDSSLRVALRNKSTATTGLVLSIFIAFYGTTGVLESMRRALNVAFRVEGGRSFLRRKTVDVASTFVLMTLVLTTMVFVVVGEELAVELFDLIGLDRGAATLWAAVRWPAAVTSAMLGFSFIYYVTPDYKHRAFHLVTPGAVLGVSAWLLVSYLLSQYISNVVNVGALYGAFTGAIVVVIWLWLSSCALLFGAELNAAIADEADAVLETGGPEVVGTGHPELVATDATAGADGPTPAKSEATAGDDQAAGGDEATAGTGQATLAKGEATPVADERADDASASTDDGTTEPRPHADADDPADDLGHAAPTDRSAPDDEAGAPSTADGPPRPQPPSGPPCP